MQERGVTLKLSNILSNYLNLCKIYKKIYALGVKNGII